MYQKTLRLSDYLQPQQAYHYARVELSSKQPNARHDHDFFELFWVFRGTAEHAVNDELHTLQEGSLVFVRPQDMHSFRSAGTKAFIGVNVAMPAATIGGMVTRFADDLSGRFFWSGDSAPAFLTAHDYPMRAVREVIGRLARSPRSALALEAFLASLFAGLLGDDLMLNGDMPPWLHDVCHKAQDPTLFRLGTSALVAASGRSHSYVCRAFERHLQQSPSAYLNRVRMVYAARRLIETQDSIAHIAEDCGVANVSHYYKLFAREHGTTPAAFRRERHRDPTRPLG
ncbi:MAG: AraC family transcriptional regulator [Pseudomonadota bacterium]